MTTIKIKAAAGDHIADVFGRAVAAAAKAGVAAEFTFSGATVQVDAASSYETTWAEIHRQWKAEADAYAAIGASRSVVGQPGVRWLDDHADLPAGVYDAARVAYLETLK